MALMWRYSTVMYLRIGSRGPESANMEKASKLMLYFAHVLILVKMIFGIDSYPDCSIDVEWTNDSATFMKSPMFDWFI